MPKPGSTPTSWSAPTAPITFAVAGPVSILVGAHLLLGVGAAWTVLTALVVVALPVIRCVRWAAPNMAEPTAGQAPPTENPEAPI